MSTALPGLRRVINAWGTATPYGVSRSSPAVAQAAAQALGSHVVMADLQAACGEQLARWAGVEAATVTHCTAASITLAVTACMTGTDAQRVARLPDSEGMPRRVLLLAAHDVQYGQPLTQAVRLAGAQPVACATVEALQAALAAGGVACMLAVESHLAAASGPALTRQLAALARAAGVPLVLDGAAQDRRIADLVASGAELVLCSAQKYLAAPTAGLVLGRRAQVAAVAAQQAGIGRAMKPTKEALAGVLAALQERAAQDLPAWRSAQARKVDAVLQAAMHWPGVTAHTESDPQGNGFDRIWLAVDPARVGVDAARLAQRLREGDPVIAVAPHRLAQGCIGLELTGVDESELPLLCAGLAAALYRPV